MELKIEVDTHDSNLAYDLLGVDTLNPGASIALSGDATLTYQGGGTTIRKDLSPRVPDFVLTFGRDLSIGLLANWLFSKLHGRAVTLRVDRTEIDIEEGQIRRILREKIERSG